MSEPANAANHSHVARTQRQQSDLRVSVVELKHAGGARSGTSTDCCPSDLLSERFRSRGCRALERLLVTALDRVDSAEVSTSPSLRTDAWLLAAATGFAAAVLIHGFDHARRGADSVGRDVFWIGTAAIVVEGGLVVLA